MASNKMLIDASHPEETRVVVLRGNRIEEFDFESQNKRQLKGNIYLAKVTRVEPSLQAAFVDYGGNRHGFLAFSEIHPDYYQIPVADRQALLDEEAADEKRDRAEEDRSDAVVDEVSEDDSEASTEAVEEISAEAEAEEKPEAKPKRRRRSRRKPAAKAAEKADGDDEKSDDAPEANAEVTAKADEDKSVEAEPAPESAEQEAVVEVAEADASDDDSDGSKSMAAMIEMDSISEPAPDEEGEDAQEEEPQETEPVAKEPAKKRARSNRRPRKKAKAEVEPEVEVEQPVAEAEAVEEKAPAEKSEVEAEAAPEAKAEVEAEPEAKADAEGEEEAKPKSRRRRRSPRSRGKRSDTDKSASADSDDDNGDTVESSGQEDALEEVPQRKRQRRHYKIQEVVKRRQVLLVQVVKEERGNKGAALTTYLSLAGRYSVLMPNTARGGGISRKITNAADRKRLKTIATELEVPEGMGVILRTAGASRSKAEIQRDFEYLMRLWENVRNLTLTSSAPCLVYEEGSLIKRSIRDLYDKNTGEVLVAGEDGHKEAQDFMEMLMPSHAPKVKLYRDEQAMFARFGVEQQLDKMLSQQVTLKSGGYLVIDQTEALVAIDVNSGRATREHSIEDTALQTNLETAEEVARQLRLRDLAGLIVIDFIDMEEKRNNRAVEKRLKDCLKNDRARIQVGRISHFGLLEMSRQRMRASVLDSTMDVCPHCQGKGHLRSNSSVALHMLRSIEEHLLKNSRFDLVVKAASEIALYILNHKRPALTEIEDRFGLKIYIEGNRDLLGENFTMDKGQPSTGERKPVTHIQAGQYADGDDTADVAEAETPAQNGEDENSGKRKRRRRRGRGNSEERAAKPEQETTGEEPAVAASAEGDGEEVREKRKRGRGKRAGRNKSKVDATENVDQPVVESASKEEVAAVAPVVAEQTEEAPVKSRNSRPRKPKKAVAAEPATTDEPVVEAKAEAVPDTVEADAAESAEAPRPKRRTTRRQPAKKTEATPEAPEAVKADDSAEPVGDVTTAAASAQSDTTSEEPEEKGKKRGGWWSRSGFFK